MRRSVEPGSQGGIGTGGMHDNKGREEMSKTTGHTGNDDDDDRNTQPARPSNTFKMPPNLTSRASFSGRWFVLIGIGLVVIFAVILATRAAVTVETGNIGIVTEWGAATNKLLQPG